jgi:hypothetical protein
MRTSSIKPDQKVPAYSPAHGGSFQRPEGVNQLFGDIFDANVEFLKRPCRF